MITIQGKSASTGIARGPLYFFRHAQSTISRCRAGESSAEWARFKAAQKTVVEQLGDLSKKARTEAGDEAALLFEAHQMMAEDPDFEETILKAIQDEEQNAEAAVTGAAALFAEMFTAMDDPRMQSRAADIKDISNRILSILTGAAPEKINANFPVILTADDLAPGEVIQLGKSKISGIITKGGSAFSHTAILARTMGIPTIVQAGDQLSPEYEGHEVILDGTTGFAVIDADTDTRSQMTARMEEQRRTRKMLQNLKGLPNRTKDGRMIRITCSINNPDEVHTVLKNDAEGIGLFRSEFLYLSRDDYPSEDFQFEAYKQVLQDMGGHEVIIRTLDIGADKQIAYLNLAKEENPALGNRGLRICLNRPEIFHTQIRALYRASAFGKLSIMFPMVSSVWEVLEAKKMCEQVKKELTDERISFDHDVQIGIMIETPAAAMISDRLAKESDFFSCGANDLTQYTLACDRRNADLGRFFDPHHTAVLRMLKMVCDNAHRNGIRIGICGELAADLNLTETILSLGIDELSVPPCSVLPLRQKVREIDLAAVRDQILDDLMSG
ncbi:MAG: phosphoenolpyruvate--protein phosphotransferase [Anaerolineaceae bacterium]|nr:phosphoenolpyruvate--protein phosphotransferase [Anaerolineaceae bacterium]